MHTKPVDLSIAFLETSRLHWSGYYWNHLSICINSWYFVLIGSEWLMESSFRNYARCNAQLRNHSMPLFAKIWSLILSLLWSSQRPLITSDAQSALCMNSFCHCCCILSWLTMKSTNISLKEVFGTFSFCDLDYSCVYSCQKSVLFTDSSIYTQSLILLASLTRFESTNPVVHYLFWFIYVYFSK